MSKIHLSILPETESRTNTRIRKKIAAYCIRQTAEELTLLSWTKRRSLEVDLQIALNDRIQELRKSGGVQ